MRPSKAEDWTNMHTAEFNYTPSQEWIFRAVAGAVKNAMHGHPAWQLDKTMARSIAKRATGTLSAEWRRALAVQSPSEQVVNPVRFSQPTPSSTMRTGRMARGASRPLGVAKAPRRRSPLKLLHNKIGAMAGTAMHEGKPERAEALIEVLRLIGAAMQKLKA